MAQTDIRIRLDGGEIINNHFYYAPGDELYGAVTIVPAGDLKCNNIFVRLQWHTEGRGQQDSARVAEAVLFQGRLAAGQPQTFDFRFTLPLEPWSYAGHHINIIWEVAVEIDLPLARNLHHTERFILAPPQRQK